MLNKIVAAYHKIYVEKNDSDLDISLLKANESNAELIYEMQIKSFLPLIEKYLDFDTNPANEKFEKIIELIRHPSID